jgi:peptide chain release factor 1
MLPIDKLESFVHRAEELDRLLCDPGVANDQARYRKLTRERAQLETLVTSFDATSAHEAARRRPRRLRRPGAARPRGRRDAGLEAQLADAERALTFMLLPPDPATSAT